VTFINNTEAPRIPAQYRGMKTIPNDTPTERLNPLNDYLFYKVMGVKGDETQLLGFLNAVLGRSGKKTIKNLEIQENNFLAADIINGKSCILDVRAILEDGTKVNIEVQLRNEHNIDRRSLFYWSRMYSESIEQGHDYKDLPNVIAINIVNFDFPPGGNYHNSFHLREDTHPDLVLTSALEIHFINMVKWRKLKEKDIKNNTLHRWLTWFDSGSPLEQITEVIGMDSSIMSAEAKKAYFSQDKDERDLYFRRLMATMDYNSGMNGARQEGLEEGRKAGRKEGHQQGREEGQEMATINIARNALAKGLAPELVQEITDLDLESIKQLVVKTK